MRFPDKFLPVSRETFRRTFGQTFSRNFGETIRKIFGETFRRNLQEKRSPQI
jgi:hypothetical protein